MPWYQFSEKSSPRRMPMVEPLFTGSEWDFQLIDRAMIECGKIAREELRLDTYKNSMEIVTSEQMLDAYASTGLPVMYKHWSFGKKFSQERDLYQKGKRGLAYELVLNTNPVINYLMEENTACTQVLVIAHAAYGHNHVFKNNYMFKQWTDADSIVDYLIFAKNYIARCEERYGEKAVEETIDSAHALMMNGIDRYKRPRKISMVEEQLRQKDRTDYLERTINDLWRTLPRKQDAEIEDTPESKFPAHPEENILYFLEKHSPVLESWQREILRIVRKMAQYFYPQYQCVTGNHLVNTPEGLFRFDELVRQDGYNQINGLDMLTDGNRYTAASHTYKHKAKVMRITTSMGRTFTGTPEHPLVIHRDGSDQMTRIEDMKVGDHMIYNLNYDIFSKSEPLLEEPTISEAIECSICGLKSKFLASHVSQIHGIGSEEYRLKYRTLSSDRSRYQKSINQIRSFPEKMNPDLAEFIAFIQCSGKINPGNSVFRYSDNDVKNVERFRNLLIELFGIEVEITTGDHDKPEMIFSSYSLKRFINHNFDDCLDKNEFMIPLAIRKSSKDTVAAWVRTLIDLRAIRRSTVSDFELMFNESDREIVNQLQTLLIGFGIMSRVTPGYSPKFSHLCKRLGLEHDGESDFFQTLRLKIIPDHGNRFESYIGTNRLDLDHSKRRHGQHHIIPGGMQLLTKIRADLIDARRAYCERTNLKINHDRKVKENLLVKQNFISSTLLPEINAKDLKLQHLINHAGLFENLKLLSGNPSVDALIELVSNAKDRFYDQIVKIEILDEEMEVYDVTIPENHLFWLDGAISHNTKVLNEGWASFTHYYIMNRLHEKGLLTDGAMLEFIKLHTSVLYQPSYDSPYFSGLNPYYLGFEIFMDIKRMCENPDDEDRRYFPDLCGGDWVEACLDAVANYRDESFIRQFLGPKVIRKMGLFKLVDDSREINYEIRAIQDPEGFREIRSSLARNYELDDWCPKVEITNADIRGDRTLTLTYYRERGRNIGDSWKTMLVHVNRLWGHRVRLVTARDSLIGEVGSS
jgi:spore cortex formation protein SpoVR/YcgB (stage V sporulation)/intein/homing endonuclease